MTEPEPTLVMPTSRPPSAPTSRVGIGRIARVVVLAWVPDADPAQVDVEAQRVGHRGEEQREADAQLEHLVELAGSAQPVDEVRTEQRHRHRADDQPLGELHVGRALALVHDRAAGLVDRGRSEVGGDDGGGVADAEEDQRRRHQRSAAHAGQADDGADEEAGREDREEGGGEDVVHEAAFRGRAASRVSLLTRLALSECGHDDTEQLVDALRAGAARLGPAAVGVGDVVRGIGGARAAGRARASRSRPRGAAGSSAYACTASANWPSVKTLRKAAGVSSSR